MGKYAKSFAGERLAFPWLPGFLGGQPLVASAFRSGLYDPEEVHFLLVTDAFEAAVRGDNRLSDEPHAYARQAQPRDPP